MYNLEAALMMLDESLSSRRKRHIIGGVLLSISLLFGGLAFTAMTFKNEEEEK